MLVPEPSDPSETKLAAETELEARLLLSPSVLEKLLGAEMHSFSTHGLIWQ